MLLHAIRQLRNMTLPLKWNIAQLKRRLYIPTVKDIMHIDQLIQHAELA